MLGGSANPRVVDSCSFDPVLPHLTSTDDTLEQVTPDRYHNTPSPSPPSKIVSRTPSTLPSTPSPGVFTMPNNKRVLQEIEHDTVELVSLFESSPDANRDDRSHTLDVGEQPMLVNHAEDKTHARINRLLSAARLNLKGSKGKVPEFCIPKEEQREVAVVFNNGSNTSLSFCTWPDKPTYGYYMVADKQSHEWIVKEIEYDGQWHAWMGASGFAPAPIVWTREVEEEVAHDTGKSIGSADADEDVDEHQAAPPKRNLRARKSVNMNPYQADRIRHNTARKTGRVLQNDEVEEAMMTQHSPKKQPGTVTNARNKKAKIFDDNHSSSDQARQSTTEGSEDIDVETIQDNTVLRTKPADMPGAIPIKLRDCGTLQDLFSNVEEKWEWRLGGGEIYYLIASFPWLDDRANILLRSGMQESFEKMMDEITSAAVWKDKRRCYVDIAIHMV